MNVNIKLPDYTRYEKQFYSIRFKLTRSAAKSRQKKRTEHFCINACHIEQVLMLHHAMGKAMSTDHKLSHILTSSQNILLHAEITSTNRNLRCLGSLYARYRPEPAPYTFIFKLSQTSLLMELFNNLGSILQSSISPDESQR